MSSCPACQHENREGARFCDACGASLVLRCAACEAELRAGARFCDACGQAVAATPAAPEAAEEPSPSEGERRQLTVMFCDLVGSTQLSERLDAEDLREAVRGFQESATGVIEALGGRVAQYLGDGILVYFGYPEAHEDDALRATRAGLRILDELPALNETLAGHLPELRERPLAARIGIHTGLVVVGAMGSGARRENLALGDTVNVAARLQEVAAPGSLVVSRATRRLLGGAFAFEELGERTLKGVARPVAVTHVLHPTGVGPAAPTARTPLVGRQQELALLLERWEETREGRGQTVLLSGEAGMGKSRLVEALRERLGEEPHSWLEGRGSPFHQSSAFHPVVELLERALFLEGELPAEERRVYLRRGLEQAGLPLEENLDLFATLLELELPDQAPLELSSEARRRRTLEALCAWLFALAEQQPLVLVGEDLHWSDPSTLELLGMLLEQAPTAPVLVLLTYRPSFVPPWPARSHVVHLPLHPLTRAQMETLVAQVAGGRPLPAEVVERIVEKTDRIPLFVEELTKTVLESNLVVEREGRMELTSPLPELAIPSTLQDSLMGRLDRLGPAKEVAQLCAALGREFSHELLEAVSPLDPPVLSQMLAGLSGAELLYQRGVPPNCVYHFKHALLQEIAYHSLLRRTRQDYHARIARALEERFPERVEAHPEVAARHFEEAGLPERAIPYYERAGERASERSANAEAIAHLGKAIELVALLPEGAERDQRELALQIALGVPLIAASGWGSELVAHAYGRARTLCQKLGESPALVRALEGLVAFYVTRSQLGDAEEVSQQLLRLAERHGRPEWLLEAHYGLGLVHYFRGEPAGAVEQLERASELYDPAVHRSIVQQRGEVPGVVSRNWGAWALWVVGWPDRAVARSREAIELARQEAHLFSVAYALAWGAVLHMMRRERDPARKCAEEAIAIADEQGYPVQLEVARLIRIWTLTAPEQPKAEIDALISEGQQALARLSETGTQAAAPQVLAGIAEAFLEAGLAAEASGYVDLALAVSATTGQPYWEADLLRLKGEVLLNGPTEGVEEEAEQLLRRAVELAHGQQARSLELRAATALARLLRERARPDEARAILSPVLGGFEEGFGTRDLQDARALLDALG